MQYLFVKYSHQIFVTITILLFNIRFFMLWRHPEKPLAGIWKAMPHLNDTMLLFTGLWAVGRHLESHAAFERHHVAVYRLVADEDYPFFAV